jgi:hypothetical protein
MEDGVGQAPRSIQLQSCHYSRRKLSDSGRGNRAVIRRAVEPVCKGATPDAAILKAQQEAEG